MGRFIKVTFSPVMSDRLSSCWIVWWKRCWHQQQRGCCSWSSFFDGILGFVFIFDGSLESPQWLILAFCPKHLVGGRDLWILWMHTMKCWEHSNPTICERICMSFWPKCSCPKFLHPHCLWVNCTVFPYKLCALTITWEVNRCAFSW